VHNAPVVGLAGQSDEAVYDLSPIDRPCLSLAACARTVGI
jgi:hypothetical protein